MYLLITALSHSLHRDVRPPPGQHIASLNTCAARTIIWPTKHHSCLSFLEKIDAVLECSGGREIPCTPTVHRESRGSQPLDLENQWLKLMR
jgi:hypothetical protein